MPASYYILYVRDWLEFSIAFVSLICSLTTLAIIWCHLLLLFTAIWLLVILFGELNFESPLGIGRWGTMAIGVSILQIVWGMHLDRSHDRSITKLWPLAPLYPLFYWLLSAFVVVWTTIPTLLTKPKKTLWQSPGRFDLRNAN